MSIDEIIRAMSAKGLRITEQRRTLAKLFAEADGYLTAKEVYEYMTQEYPGLSFDTVYRNLRVLYEMDVLEQFVFEEGMKFKLHCNGQEHHHHLICLQCDRTVPISFCPMDEVLAEVPEHFQVVKHKFEVYGYCEDCQK